MKRKSMRKGMLRAAVALSLLGGIAVPAESEAYYLFVYDPTDTGVARFAFVDPLDWKSPNYYEYSKDLKDYSGIKLSLSNDFYAENIDSTGEKIIAAFHKVYKKHMSSGLFKNDRPNNWNCQGTSASRLVTFEDLSQNGVKLRNEREHQIRAEFIGLPDTAVLSDITPYYCYIIYSVKDVSNSYLDFENRRGFSGITWNNGGSLFSLDHKFDFGTNGLSINMDSLKISNQGDIKLGDSMTLINAGSYYDYSTFYNKVSPSLYKTKSFDFGNKKLKNSVTASGKVNVQTGISNSNGNLALTLDAKSYTLNSLNVDLSKIGDGEGKDPWKSGGDPLYESANINPSTPLTITISNLIGGDNDAYFQGGTSMTLLNLSGTKSGTIITKYGNDTTNITGGSKSMTVNFSDKSAGGVVVSGTRTDTLSSTYSTTGFLGSNYIYALNYAIGKKDITDVTASTIDFSNNYGGFVADAGYTFKEDKTLDLSNTTFKGSLNGDRTTYTLLDLSKASGNGELTVKGKDDPKGEFFTTVVSDKYTTSLHGTVNGVTPYLRDDIKFQSDGKKITYSVTSSKISDIELGKVDVTKLDSAPTYGNLVKEGTIDDSKFSLTGIKSLQEAANKYNTTLTLAKAKDGETYNFSNWKGYSKETKGYQVYNDNNGITATLAGTLDTTGGNINLKTDGIYTLSYGNISWKSDKSTILDTETSFLSPTVELNGGKLGTVDLSGLKFKDKPTTKFGLKNLLYAQNLDGDVTVQLGEGWGTGTTDGNTTIYKSTQRTNDSVTAAGMTLSSERADQIGVTKTDSFFNVTYEANRRFATGFKIADGGITWTNGGKGLELTENYDYSLLREHAITFDASDPYALIANPDQVAIGSTMVLFKAKDYMDDSEWDKLVYIDPSKTTGESKETDKITDRAVEIAAKVKLDLTNDKTNKQVTAKISDEYLSRVSIDLSKIGKEETKTNNQWEKGDYLYSQTISTQDYAQKNTNVTVSGSLFGANGTDESVKAGDEWTLVHIEGKNAGVAGNITTSYSESKEENAATISANDNNFKKEVTVQFSDKADNGIVAKGSHVDTIESTVSGEGEKGTYDLTYTVGKKTVTGITGTHLDLTQGALTAFNGETQQYTLGTNNVDVNVSQLVIDKVGDMKEPTAIINFSGDKADGKFVLSGGTSNTDGTMTTSITYAEAEAVNGVKAEGHENNTYSSDADGKIVYLDSIKKDVSKVIIGTVDLSDNATRRSFDNLTEAGTIDAKSAKYTANKAIDDVAGKTLTVVGVTEGSKNTFKNWGEQPAATTIAVNQATGIDAVVNAKYDTSDGNINLKGNGVQSITFGSGIAWNKDTTAVSLTGQNVGTVDFSCVSFSDNGVVKNETMRLLDAQGMTQAISTIKAPTEGWTKRNGENGTTYYNKKTLPHDEKNDLSGNGITLTVNRGDQIVETSTSSSYTLDYTRGKGYVTKMSIASDGITWEDEKTAITLNENYDFSALAENGIKFDGEATTFSNLDKASIGKTMTLFDANGHMSLSDWTNKVNVTGFPLSENAYEETNKAVTVSGKVNMEVTKTEATTDKDDMKVTAKVTESYLSNIAVDLSKIGNAETTDENKWDTTNPLYKNTENKQNYGDKDKPTTVTISGSLFGGTTDETVKAGDIMTLVYIEGTHAGTEGNIKASVSGADLTDEGITTSVNFSDTADNGLVAKGSHVDTIKSTADQIKDSYTLTYTIGNKVINAIDATSIDLTKENHTFTAGTQYTLSGDNITVDVTNAKINYTESSANVDIIDFTGSTGSFKLANAGADSKVVSNSVAYSEEQETNGIQAAGVQNRTFSVSENGKKVSLDLTQEVNKVTVGMVDMSKDIRTFTNLAKEGSVAASSTTVVEDGTTSVKGTVILDNLALTKDLDRSFTVAKATGTYGFSGWTLPDEKEDVYCRQETGVVGIMEGKFKATTDTDEKGNEYSALKIEMVGIKSINFYDGVKWRNDSPVLDFVDTGISLAGKSIDASKLAFDSDSVKNLVTTDGAYRMVLINTEESNHLAQADITNNENISMTIADTITFKGETKLSADKLQFVADMWRGTGTVSDAAHRHAMAQSASSQAIVNGNVEATDSISRALSHYRADDKDENSMIFASIGGSKTKTETGSHISQNLWNVNAGVGTRKDLANGAHTEYGLYYEGGTGKYSTFGAGEGIARTSGDLTHHGAGFLFRYENKNNVYGEAGIHAGRVKNENKALGLDDSATYYGLHLGVGKIIETSDSDSWDIYTKFYLNRTGGLHYKNSDITQINLDSVTSKLLRIGGRYNHQAGHDWSFYAGAAFAYEFGGNANGTAGIINGDFGSLRTATTKGGGALLELGFRKEAVHGSPWDIDLGLKGYLGRQKGIGGNIGVNYHF